MQADRFSVLRSPAGPGAVVAYTGTAGSISQAVRGSCVMVWCSTDAYVAVGATATTSATPLPAFTPIFLPLNPNMDKGQTPSVLVSAIQVSGGGNLYAQQFE